MSTQKLGRSLALALSVTVAALPVWPAAAVAAEEKVTIDFRNVDISEFVKTVSKLTERNFLLDQGVRGSVTILGPRPVGVSEIWRIFHSVLAVKGLTVVKVGSLYKIVQRKNAKQQPVPIVVGRDITEISEEPVIQIVPMDFSSAVDAKAFLDSFKSANGEIMVHEPTNSLIFADQRDYIARMLRLLQHMDSAEVEETIEIIYVRHMAVDTAIKLINEIKRSTGEAGSSSSSKSKSSSKRSSSSSGKKGEGARIVSDSRLNRLIVIGTKDEIDEVKDLLAILDVEEDNLQTNVHVYPLQHADAETLAGTLNSIGSSQSAAKKSKDQKTSTVKIVADKHNNALIFITENSEDLKAQLRLLEMLDVAKAQVFIEAAIVEVSLNDNGSFSLGLAGGAPQSALGKEGFVGGGRGLDATSLLANPGGLFSTGGIAAGALFDAGSISIGDSTLQLPPFGAILSALKTNALTNVLSTPQILTSDNEEAEIVVGDNVPFLTGQTATSGGNVISSIDRRDVGLTLRVTPQVNESGMVRLAIFQEISDVGEAPGGLDVNQQGLVTRKRSARTNVVVKDGQTIAIGGLYTTTESKSEQKVPVLGDIPILGWLFKSTSKTKRRTNLILFLSPTIVRGATALDEYSLDLLNEFEDRYGDRFIDQQVDYFNDVRGNSTRRIADAQAAFEADMVVEISPGDAMPAPVSDPATDEVPAQTPYVESHEVTESVEPMGSPLEQDETEAGTP